MRVVQLTLQVNYANVFLAIDEKSGDAFLVDCGAFEEQVRSAIEGLSGELKFLLLTHSHYDHVDGLEKFKQAWNVPVYAFDSRFGRRVREGDTIPFAGDEIAVLE
ncbi:MAG: MBL fold metallo-hydrolase, partial [Calditrichaeota bacterium]